MSLRDLLPSTTIVLSHRVMREIAEALGDPAMIANGMYALPLNCRVVYVEGATMSSAEDVERSLRWDRQDAANKGTTR